MNNTATVLDIPLATPTLRDRRTRLLRAGSSLWRVTAPDGRVIGHLRAVESGAGLRYRAEHFHPATGSFILFGEFWSADEAVSALRYAR